MPIYVYECAQHGQFESYEAIANRDKAICSVKGCTERPKRLVATSQPVMFHAGWYEHITPKGPIYIDSMRKLKEECRKHGILSRYAEDSSLARL